VDERKFRLHDGKGGSALTVRVIPKASKNEVVEILTDGTIKVRLVTQVPQTYLEIVAGYNGPDKLVSVVNLDTGTVQERIMAKIG
jgi:uncharacterized protein YggU (UPF0235/DUF167 family)